MFSFKRRHPIVKKLFNVFLKNGFEGAYINKVYQEMDILYANITIPSTKDYSSLDKLLPNLQQEVGATAAKLGKRNGKNVEILFGMRELCNSMFHSSLLKMDSLEIKFPSAFGEYILDFEDGASCHMLNGGMTRMGKTCLLLYIATTLWLQTGGKMKLYISSAKLKDYYPFHEIPNVKMSKEEGSMVELLQEVKKEYKIRDDLLYSSTLKKATDAKSVRNLYPEQYHLFEPIFLIIDEYARFAENKKIQKLVTELVETAGFVNIHVIIASQRPDATTVLKARIRANLSVRIAFSTVDRKNSEIILDKEGAEQLGKITGRAMLSDGEIEVIQVPYLDVIECDRLLQPYQTGEKTDVEDQERCNDNEVADKIQSMLQESDSLSDLSGEFQSGECSKQGIETDGFEWLHQPNTERKG